MTRGATTTAVILALLTGLVLGQIGSLAPRQGHVPVTESNVSPRALATARSFYEGFDRLLDFGDRSIESTVTPGFVDHGPNDEASRTLPEMIAGMLALRATWPHLRIHVVDLQQHQGLIAVRLNIDPGVPSQIAGVPLTSSPPYQVLELLRIEGAAVSERWTAAGQLPVATFSLIVDVRWKQFGLVVPAIERISVDPGRPQTLPHRGPVMLWVASGQVRLDRAGTDPERIKHRTQEPLDVGAVRLLDGNDTVDVQALSAGPAEVWVVSADAGHGKLAVPVDAALEPANPPVVSFMPLQPSAALRGSPMQMSILQLTLPPGTSVPDHLPGVIEAIAVLDGALSVSVDGGRALYCSGGTAHPFESTETIALGEGVAANATTSLAYRATGPYPTMILVMRIDTMSPLAAPIP